MKEAVGVEDGTTRLVDTLARLCDLPGIPGQEVAVRQALEEMLAPCGAVTRDGLGGLTCTRTGTAQRPRVVLAAHMDEVGYVISDVTEKGFLRFVGVGGWWEQVMLAQRVQVHTRAGTLVGVVGSKPPHVLPAEKRKEAVDKHDMFIDIGARSAAEAGEWGVRPGDMVVPVCPFQPLWNPEYLLGKAMDDRAGCAILVEVMRRLAEGAPHPNTVVAAATVQEEVGLRGAQVAGQIADPDVAFALDVGIAGDTPGMQRHEARGVLGQGPTILVYDSSLVPNPRLRDFVADTAADAGIPVQWDAITAGGTDAGRLHLAGAGVPALVVSFPARYIHSAASIVHRADLEATVRLLVAVLARLDAAAVATIRG